MQQMPASTGEAPSRIRTLPTWQLARANQRAHRLLVEGLGRVGFRGHHYRLLAALEESGPTSQVVLSRRTSIDRSDVVVTLDELGDRGLVERSTDPEDRRRNVITITSAGLRELAALDRVVAKVQDDLLSPLPRDDQRRFLDLLARIQADA